MTTVVETSEEEPLLTVALFIGELLHEGEEHTALADTPAKRYAAECEGLMEEGRWNDLLVRLLDSSSIMFGKASDKDVETCFLVICNVVCKLPEAEALQAADKIVAAVTVETSDSALRLRALLNLFNLMPYNTGKYSIILATLEYCASTALVEPLLPAAKRADVWVKEWGIGNEETRALWSAFAKLLQGYKPASKDYFNFLIKYLTTFENVENPPLEKIETEAVLATKEFVTNADLFHCDLLDLKCIQKVKDSPKVSGTFKLLGIFLTGRLSDYLTAYKADPKLVEDLGLSHEDCVSKMRLMSLAALGNEGESGEIPYSLVKDALQIDISEVETWVVKAIGLKLLEAKMDQLREVVVISRCSNRVFEAAQWEELRSKLEGWKGSVGNVCKVVGQLRAGGHSVDPLLMR